MSELKESKEQFCFVRDDSAHWYLLPLRFKEDFNKFKEEENEEMMEKFSGYLLGSSITNISFSDPTDEKGNSLVSKFSAQ